MANKKFDDYTEQAPTDNDFYIFETEDNLEYHTVKHSSLIAAALSEVAADYVPYDGASTNLNMGDHNIILNVGAKLQLGAAGGEYIWSNANGDVALESRTQLRIYADTNNAGNPFEIYNGLGVGDIGDPAFVVKDNEVGINNTNPSAMLHLGAGYNSLSAISPTAIIYEDTNAIKSLHLENANSGSTAEMRFVTRADNGDYMAFSTPSSGNINTLFGDTRNLGSFVFTNGRPLYLGTVGVHDVKIGTGNGTPQLNLKASNGYVGIGTESPSSKLDVIGNVEVSGNIVVAGTVDGRDVATDGSTQDSHIADSTIHFTQASISIPASQVSDFDTEVANNTAVTANTAKVGVTTEISNVVEDTTPQLGGDLDWNSNGHKLVSQTVGGSNGNAVQLTGSNTWGQADASTESTADGMIGIRISATEVLTHGVYTTTGLTAGATYYLSETAGAITTTAPTTSTSIVRVIAYALSTTELFVFPDDTFIEVV